MVVLYARSECFSTRRLPSSTGQLSPVPARLAHKVAHETRNRRKPLPKVFGYRARGSWSEATYRLQHAFLTAAVEVCPRLLADLEDLRPMARRALNQWKSEGLTPRRLWADQRSAVELALQDKSAGLESSDVAVALLDGLAEAVNEWGERYLLTERWPRRGALHSLLVAEETGKTLSLTPGAVVYAVPEEAPPLVVELPGYDGDGPLGDYTEAARAAFEEALREHALARIQDLDANPALERVAHGGKPTDEAIRAAAAWQTLGEPPARPDTRTVRKVFKQIFVRPRQGLPRTS